MSPTLNINVYFALAFIKQQLCCGNVLFQWHYLKQPTWKILKLPLLCVYVRGVIWLWTIFSLANKKKRGRWRRENANKFTASFSPFSIMLLEGSYFRNHHCPFCIEDVRLIFKKHFWVDCHANLMLCQASIFKWCTQRCSLYFQVESWRCQIFL